MKRWIRPMLGRSMKDGFMRLNVTRLTVTRRGRTSVKDMFLRCSDNSNSRSGRGKKRANIWWTVKIKEAVERKNRVYKKTLLRNSAEEIKGRINE